MLSINRTPSDVVLTKVPNCLLSKLHVVKQTHSR